MLIHRVAYHKSRDIEGKVKTVTVKRDSIGDIYIYLVCETESHNQVIARLGKSIGFDFGLKKHICNVFVLPIFVRGIRLILRVNPILKYLSVTVRLLI